jgi:CubicO group peptidase (beta-lactamase class C family)
LPRGVDARAVEALRRRAEATKSDALVVVKDGKLLGHGTFGTPDEPIESTSAAKSVVALAVAKLVEAGRLRSLDEPEHALFSEWK